ncbi:MAG: tetratricopeptide repeat protein [Caldilineaceae bacterium]|nr:tetratricopeptide repeat protein [Caldilineaceae bacterium]
MAPGLAYTWNEIVRIFLLLVGPPWTLLALLMWSRIIETPTNPYLWLGYALGSAGVWGAFVQAIPAAREILRPQATDALPPIQGAPATPVPTPLAPPVIPIEPPTFLYPRLTPPAPPRLFGRTAFLNELVADLCQPDAPRRPLALTALQGLPGIGKTALALAIAHHPQIKQTFPDGQFWISLGPQPDLMIESGLIIEELGGSMESAITLRDRADLLKALLRGKQLLLLVDDVWQVDDARIFLDACAPPTRVLITTRHAQIAMDLHAAIREVWVLLEQPSLAVLAVAGPGARAAVDADTDGARRLAEEVGHLPLALEVAGRYLNRLAEHTGAAQAIATLRQELNDEAARVLRLRAAQRRPGLDDAQPSLEAVLGLSYTHHLGDDATRRAFRTLAVFGAQPLTFDLPALSAVWGGVNADSSPAQINEWRIALADAGLLQNIAEDSPARYRVHQIVAAYAMTLLRQTPAEQQAAALAYARHYAGLVESADDLITGDQLLAGLAWLDKEIDQVRRAIGWALGQTSAEGYAALRDLVRPLRNYAIGARSLHREIAPWLEGALNACRALQDRSGEANVLKAQGDVLQFLKQMGEALEKYEAALGLFRAVGDRLGEANVLKAQGDALIRSGDVDEGMRMLEAARRLYAAIGARAGLSNVGITLARYAISQNNLAAAIEYMQPAADFGQEIGHPLGAQLQAQIDGWRAALQDREDKP